MLGQSSLIHHVFRKRDTERQMHLYITICSCCCQETRGYITFTSVKYLELVKSQMRNFVATTKI